MQIISQCTQLNITHHQCKRRERRLIKELELNYHNMTEVWCLFMKRKKKEFVDLILISAKISIKTKEKKKSSHRCSVDVEQEGENPTKHSFNLGGKSLLQQTAIISPTSQPFTNHKLMHTLLLMCCCI